jgi:hypothetical protein
MNIVSFLAEGTGPANTPVDTTNGNRYEFKIMEYGRLTGATEGTTTATRKNITITAGSVNN